MAGNSASGKTATGKDFSESSIGYPGQTELAGSYQRREIAELAERDSPWSRCGIAVETSAKRAPADKEKGPRR